MAERIRVKIEGSTSSVEKGTTLSDLMAGLELARKPLFARIDDKLKVWILLWKKTRTWN